MKPLPMHTVELVDSLSGLHAAVAMANARKQLNELPTDERMDTDTFFEILKRANASNKYFEEWDTYKRVLRAGLELALERLKP